jgi:hypothetical protein
VERKALIGAARLPSPHPLPLDGFAAGEGGEKSAEPALFIFLKSR